MDKKKVLVLGGSGMLGHMVVDYLRHNESIDLTATMRPSVLVQEEFKPQEGVAYQELYVGSKMHVVPEFMLHELNIRTYDYVINCIGQIKPRIKDEADPNTILEATTLNAILPAALVQGLERNPHQRLISIATDCVFTGRKGGQKIVDAAYDENDPHDVMDLYGRTKSMGEIPHPNHIIIRTSIIGPEINNKYSLLEWFLGLKEGAKVNGYNNHYWNGITTLAFAKIAENLITREEIELCNDVHHCIPRDTINKYQLLLLFASIFGREDVNIHQMWTKEPINRKLTTRYPADNKLLWDGYGGRPWISSMVQELKTYMEGPYLQ